METVINNETVQNMLADLGIDANYSSISLVKLAETNSKYLRELKLNVSTVLGSANLTKREAYLLALSVTANEKNNVLSIAFEQLAIKEGATLDDIAETHACASLLSINNVFYRFRHFMKGNEFYNSHPLGLRMGIMLAPAMGKPLFELMSLVVSAINGCEQCVVSHEHSVKEQNTPEPKIYDAIRLGAVIKGLCTII